MKHMEDVFTVDTKHAVKIKGVFLVDDVCTTGATLRSTAYVLKKQEYRGFGVLQWHDNMKKIAIVAGGELDESLLDKLNNRSLLWS